MKNNRSGFSFIEILVVVAIISILATIVGVSIWPQLSGASVTAAKTQIGNFRTALATYYKDNLSFPTAEQGLSALCKAPTLPPEPKHYQEGGYLDSRDVPKDPWGSDYIYNVPGPEGKPYEIISLGRDGKEGGEGADADISSLDL